MKRMVALFFAAIFSIFAGVEFVLPKDDNFIFADENGSSAYFLPEKSGEVQYKSLYGQVFGVNGSGAEMCDTTPKPGDRPEWVELSTRVSDWSAGIFDPVYVGDDSKVEVTTSANTIKYVLSGEIEICAPASGTIETSHFSCDWGSKMTYTFSLVDGNSYTMEIEGAKCWFCCAHKEPPENGRYTATTSDSMKGKAMRAGEVLCIGKEDTVVLITRSRAN